MKERAPAGWKPPVVLTDAVTGKGTEELGAEILRHRDCLEKSGELGKRRNRRDRTG
jgi:putative protein kinase ArgK-like GTPase of G3E family